MDYEKKYKEAVKAIKELSDSFDDDNLTNELGIIFPELKESEDEKNKRILRSISSKMSLHLRDIFTEEEFQCFNAWFEKQGEQKHQYKSRPRYVGETELLGEQKPAKWSEEDEKMLKDTIRFCELCGNKVSANWLKSIKEE